MQEVLIHAKHKAQTLRQATEKIEAAKKTLAELGFEVECWLNYAYVNKE